MSRAIAAGALGLIVVVAGVSLGLLLRTANANAAPGAGQAAEASSAPRLTGAQALSGTSVLLSFSVALLESTVDTTGPAFDDFAIVGLDIVAVEVADPTHVLLVTTDQVGGAVYTVRAAAGSLAGLKGVTNGESSASLTGYVAVSEDRDPPSVPSRVVAASGTVSPIVAFISWVPSSDNIETVGYRVWRSVGDSGKYSSIGTTEGPSFADAAGSPGRSYRYRISAFDAAGNESAQSAPAGPVRAMWKGPPHGAYTDSTRLCGWCHGPHTSAPQGSARQFRDVAKGIDEGVARAVGKSRLELAICYTCHDGTAAAKNTKTGRNSFALASGHRLESESGTASTSAADLTSACSSCHNPHADYVSRENEWRADINASTVSGGGKSWCFACHNDAQDWYYRGSLYAGSTYPTASAPMRDGSGYPVLGTYPGRTSYSNTTANAHALIASGTLDGAGREQGDCRYCHNAHGSANPYDALASTYRPTSVDDLSSDQTDGTYAEACFACHASSDDASWVPSAGPGAVDIKTFAVSDSPYAGHRVLSRTASLPVGAPLPCYECHSPHGSLRGNAALLADQLGQDLTTSKLGGNAEQTRQFCFACHSSSDSPTAYVWDSVAATYTPVTATMTVVGLRRDGTLIPGWGPNGETANWLVLKPVPGHGRAEVDADCLDCHGHDYSGPGSFNVHNPSGGTSLGVVRCYSCHSAYRAMDAADPQKGSAFHHVLGTSTEEYTGDLAPGTGAYPTSAGDVYCVSCHVDHSYFNTAKGANLRVSIESTATTNTDFLVAESSTQDPLSYGVCVSCHAVSLEKDTANQKSDGTTATVAISGPGYQASVHNYVVSSSFGGDPVHFDANCAKCHSDDVGKPFQTSDTREFGTHLSSTRRIVASFGGTIGEPAGADHCFGCHSLAGDGYKAVDGYDFYGVAGAAMKTTAQATFRSLRSGASFHPLAGDSLLCENCHNPHLVTASTKTADPDDTTVGYRFADADTAMQVAFCLKCHDGAPPVYSNGTAYVPLSVTIATYDSDKSVYAASAHWAATGSISPTEVVGCAACHDTHGSKAPKLLGTYDAAADQNAITWGSSVTTITANDNTVCFACHASASSSYGSPSFTASGYPMDGTWPGEMAYTTVYNPLTRTGSMHTSPGTIWPGARGRYRSGDCKNCHDVHGTAAEYDQLRTETSEGVRGFYRYAPSDFGFCFNCHDADGPAMAGGDIRRYYPTEVSGTALQTPASRFGHKTETTGTLPAGSALPCYDCHNPHGSRSAFGLTIIVGNGATTRTVGDEVGEIEMSPALRTPTDVRRFCLTCHTADATSADSTTYGWGGAATETVTGGSVEGIDRTTGALHLSAVPGHYVDTDAWLSCYSCHGDDYSTSTSANVHNPGRGVPAAQ